MALGAGGGVYSCTFKMLTITNSTLLCNSAIYGGGIYTLSGSESSTATIANCTLSANSASDRGGAVCNYGVLTLCNSILWQNHGGEVEGGGKTSAFRNLIGIDPMFVRNPLREDDELDTAGVRESSNEDVGDLHLTQQSPAIGYGDNDSAIGVDGCLPTTDFDGNIRIFGESVDCGAFEFQGEAAAGREVASSVVTTQEDVFDAYDGTISLREAIYYSPTDVQDATVTFDRALNGSTITLSGKAIWIDKPLAIDASSLTSVTVDADGKSRAFAVIARDGDVVSLDHLTITGGLTTWDGGGIINTGTLTVTHSTLLRNSAGDGGAICNIGTLTSMELTLVSNSASCGGAIRNSGVPTIVNSMLSRNSVESHGGGIFNTGALTVANGVVSCNSARTGGGIYNAYGGMLTLANSTLSGNSASEDSGGIVNYEVLTLSNSVLWQNDGGELEGSGKVSAFRSLIGIDPEFVRDPWDGGGRLGRRPGHAGY